MSEEQHTDSTESVSPDNLMNQILELAGVENDNREEASPQIDDRQQVTEDEGPLLEGKSETGGEEEDSKATPAIPRYYTAEELIELGQGDNFDKLDTSKIPPELQPVYKSFQAMATRKQQVLAEKERELDTQKQAAPAPTPVDYSNLPLPQRIVADPFGARNDLFTELQQTERDLREADSQDDFFKAQKLLIRRSDLRDQLADIDRHINTVAWEFQQMSKAVPDIQTKGKVLTEYLNTLMDDDPFSPEELNYLTNPAIVGAKARKIVKLVNKLYTQSEQLKVSAQEKLQKTPPPPSERPQTGVENTFKQKKDQEIRQLRKRAQQSGDNYEWAEFIAGVTRKDQ